MLNFVFSMIIGVFAGSMTGIMGSGIAQVCAIAGYQVLGSLRAIRSGGFLGKGLGLGTMKLSSVPEVQSDFIFAVAGRMDS